MATSTPQPVLSLTTIIPRQLITIDGKPYELLTADEFSWLVYRGQAGVFRQAAALMKPGRTKKDEKAIERLLVPLVAQVVKAPKAVLARLTNAQRYQVLEVFSRLLPKTTSAAAGVTAQRRAAMSPAGGRSSRKTRSASR